MSSSVYAWSLKGHREQNEDKHRSILNLDGTHKNYNKVNFFAVYDGHGGKDVSTFLDKHLPKYFMSTRTVYPLSKNYVNSAYNALQSELKDYKYAYTSGSTATVVINYKCNNHNYINVMNTGDSRCVLCRGNFAVPLTKDHKPSWPEEKHRITQKGGKPYFDGHDWRINNLSVSPGRVG